MLRAGASCGGEVRRQNKEIKNKSTDSQGGLDMSKLDVSVRRRPILKAGIALGASQVIGAPAIIAARGEEPGKIGMVDPLTGVLSALAQSEVDGARYAEAELNRKGGILALQVQLLVEDTANDVSA